MAEIPQSIPDPALFANGDRQCVFFSVAAGNKPTALVVIYTDTFEHQIYGPIDAAAQAFWIAVAKNGKNLVQRASDAEQRCADLEKGITIGFRAELRSRLAEITSRSAPAAPYNLADPADVDRLTQDLGFDP